jgi:hypothetical protein
VLPIPTLSLTIVVPITSSLSLGVVVPIPTRLVDASALNVVPPQPTSSLFLAVTIPAFKFLSIYTSP